MEPKNEYSTYMNYNELIHYSYGGKKYYLTIIETDEEKKLKNRVKIIDKILAHENTK